MIRYAVQRATGAAGVLLVVSFLVYWLGTFIPGDAATVIVGSEGATAEQYHDLRQRLGLDDPIPVQYVHWLANALHGDFGKSPISGRQVADDIGRQLPVSLELAVFSILGSVVIGLPVGVAAARRANRRSDLALRSGFLVLFSIPPFVAGVLLVLVGSLYLGPLYQSRFVPLVDDPVGNLRSILLPTLAVALPLAAMTAQMTRTALLEVLSEPYIVTARSKGLRDQAIVYGHALKNALVPVVTLQGYIFGSLLGGLIVTEQIFNLPGLGRGLLTALSGRDYPLVIGGTLVIAASYIMVNLAVDLTYPVLDPAQAR